MARVTFSKYQGAGNDFICVDDRDENFPLAAVESLCDRRFGVGADGVVLLQPSTKADIRMRIFNSDGGEAEMCGNGLRCLLGFIVDKSLHEKANDLTIETMDRVLRGSSVGSKDSSQKERIFRVEMEKPTGVDFKLELPIEVDGEKFTVQAAFLDTGVPHCIVFVEDLPPSLFGGDSIASLDLDKLGPIFRRHSSFGSAGANANFVEKSSDGEVTVRTFERGVEGETFACGTGATAAGIAAGVRYSLPAPVPVKVNKGRSVLEIGFKSNGGEISDVTMTGPAKWSFDGVTEAE